MVLTPSKVFGSVHQLRHYFQAKISELVVLSAQPHNTNTLATTTTRSLTKQWKKKNFTQQQQSPNTHSSLLLNGYSQQQAALVHNIRNASKNKHYATYEKFLLNTLQEQFPVFKAFSAPNLYKTTTSAAFRQPQCTMWSGSSHSPFVTGLFGRSNTATRLGLMGRFGHTAAARQFSSTTVNSPCMTSLFHSQAAATGQQPGILGYVTYRIFSPAVDAKKTTMTQKQGDTVNNRSELPADKTDGVANNSKHPMKNLITSSFDRAIANANCRSRTSFAESNCNILDANKEQPIIASEASILQQRTKPSTLTASCKRSFPAGNLAVQETDNKHTLSNATLQRNKKARVQTYRTPGGKCQRGTQETYRVKDGKPRNRPSWDTTSGSYITFSKVFYVVVNLDPQQFYDIDKDEHSNEFDMNSLASRDQQWQTERLTQSFVDSVEAMAYRYQVHMNYVMQLLDNLFRHATAFSSSLSSQNGFEVRANYHHQFRIVRRNSGKELRIYFPPKMLDYQQQPFCSKKDVLDYLCSINAIDHSVYEKLKFFSIATEDRHFVETAHGITTDTHRPIKEEEEEEDRQNDDYFSFKSPMLSDTVVGPDYFRQLQMFLDQTDYLIDTSPAFKSTVSIA